MTRLKKEAGDGGISYAMYFIALILCTVLFFFYKFNASLYIVEEVVENGLHIAENKTMTSNYSGTGVDEYGFRTDDFEKEMRRMHIINPDADETRQIVGAAEAFTEALAQQLQLDAEGHPVGGTLEALCDESSKVSIVGPVMIYEPTYKRNVSNIGSITSPEFEITYDIVEWNVYTINYNDNNEYSDYIVSTQSGAPTLLNGKPCEGATIEATIGLTLAGIKNSFANVNQTRPQRTEGVFRFHTSDGHEITAGQWDLSGTEGGLFSATPEYTKFAITATQSTDIVIANRDSRQK